MPEDQRPPEGGKQRPGAKKPGGPMAKVPPWAYVLGGLTLVGLYLLLGRKKTTPAATTSQPTAVPVNGLGTDQATAIYAALQALGNQLSNLNNPPTSSSGQKYTLLEYPTTNIMAWSLNDLAAATGSTPQAIIDNTIENNKSIWDEGSDLGQYFRGGMFDQPLPDGFTVDVPIFAPPGSSNGTPMVTMDGYTDIVTPNPLTISDYQVNKGGPLGYGFGDTGQSWTGANAGGGQ